MEWNGTFYNHYKEGFSISSQIQSAHAKANTIESKNVFHNNKHGEKLHHILLFGLQQWLQQNKNKNKTFAIEAFRVPQN